MKGSLTEFDNIDYYERECKPVLEELIRLCYTGRIPMYFTAAVKNDEKGTEYRNDGVLTGSNNINLKDDQIKYHLMVSMGCIATTRAEEFELDMDELMQEYN